MKTVPVSVYVDPKVIRTLIAKAKFEGVNPQVIYRRVLAAEAEKFSIIKIQGGQP